MLRSDISQLRAQILSISKASLHLFTNTLDLVLNVRDRGVPLNDSILLEERECTYEPRPATEAALPIAADVAVATAWFNTRETRLHIVGGWWCRVAENLDEREVQSVFCVVNGDRVDECYLVRLDRLREIATPSNFRPLVARGNTVFVGEVDAPVKAGYEKLSKTDIERVLLE